jgi:hypothetical protein
MSEQNNAAPAAETAPVAAKQPGFFHRAGSAVGRFLMKPYIVYPTVGAACFTAGYYTANYMAAKAAGTPAPTDTPTA